MKCPECQFDNREEAKFCSECGFKFVLSCPDCGNSIRASSKFCDECGCALEPPLETFDDVSEIEGLPIQPAAKINTEDVAPIVGERKHVTVFFSDLTGYTAMSEKLDPEEVKEITTQIFDGISKIVSKYEGFIEKFAGDAVMALFGAKETHEDDPVRAIKAAREIHNFVNTLNPKYEKIMEEPLSMHTGINTGLVVTGEVNLEKGTHGVVGDTINVAARLSAMGNAGEILIGPETFYLSEGYFDFEELKPVSIKGKSAPFRVYKFLAQKEQPIKLHRLHGFKADLIGRKAEMNQLSEAVRNLWAGKGSVFSIYGAAGTGKSRLIQDFKASLNLEKIQWLEGQAYPFSENIPYYPLTNLLSQSLQIKEDDQPEEVRKKVEAGLGDLIGRNQDLIPYIGSLFSLSYSEIEEVSPEHWKTQLHRAIQTVVSALAKRAPTIICLEDLHWADPSFLELLRQLIPELIEQVLFLCAYRPIISLFNDRHVSTMASFCQEISLQDFSSTESEAMIKSLLKIKKIPLDLKQFVHYKIEGNPFYIEEFINSLIESDTLIRNNDNWKLAKSIKEAGVPSNIHGVIADRLDRLEKENKRILQEASVIGRSFFYEILNRITEHKKNVDHCLSSLERLDLIRTKSLQPDLEYIFKHALTQEVAYSGLLRKERLIIHERIALVIEKLFHDRLAQFYESLAFHFSRSLSADKAIDYLIKSGRKSYNRFSLKESAEYFKDAYEILSTKSSKTKIDNLLLIDLLLEWAHVLNNSANYKAMLDLLNHERDIAESSGDKKRLGLFYAWLAWAFQCSGQPEEGYHIGLKGLEFGEQIGDEKIIGYTCTFLSFICTNLGLLEDAIRYGERTQKSKFVYADQDLFRLSSHAIGIAYAFRGKPKKTEEIGRNLIDYGEKISNHRCLSIGHSIVGYGQMWVGDLQSAIKHFIRAIQISPDPGFAINAKVFLGMSYISNNQTKKAENILKSVIQIRDDFEVYGGIIDMLNSVVLLAKGNFKQGIVKWERTVSGFKKIGSKIRYAMAYNLIGKFYAQLASRSGPIDLSLMVRNIGFLVKNVPFARKKAETHFKKAIEIASEIGAKSIVGQAKLDLGKLYKTKGRTDKARNYLSAAIQIFEECEAEIYLKQAREAIASLG
jgi:class 3 adenylate cyclase/tetratricopeptide (TPR) repeat protein